MRVVVVYCYCYTDWLMCVVMFIVIAAEFFKFVLLRFIVVATCIV